jgi:hypothetical protein
MLIYFCQKFIKTEKFKKSENSNYTKSKEKKLKDLACADIFGAGEQL